MDTGLLLLRVVAGGVMAAHGAQKLFGWFGGYGIAGTGGYFESLGFRPGRAFAAAAGASEVVGGLLILFGLLGPVGPAIVLATMIVAAVSVHWQNGLFAQNGGIELALLYAVAVATLALTGPGAYSLDAAFGIASVWTPEVTWAVLVVGVLGGIANLAVRRPARVEA
ncbi:MAG TPA: DoxX family protein [Vicinamibacterales bacterium]|nr:DoxX family protein [Vicinamibacterales bacterium]